MIDKGNITPAPLPHVVEGKEARRIIGDLVGHARFVAVNFDIHYAHLHEAEAFLSGSSEQAVGSSDLQQEMANLTGILEYMENTNARTFDPSRVVFLIALVRDRLSAAVAAQEDTTHA